MKKFVRNLLPITIIAAWVIFMGVLLFVGKDLGKEIRISAHIILTIASIGLILFAGYFDYPYSKYLESNDGAKPTFRVPCSSVIAVPKGFNFSRLKTEIGEKWLITFSDDTCHILKFRARPHFRKFWGVAAWLKFDADTAKIQLECFPLGGIQHDSQAKKMQNEIEQCLISCEPT
jgi:hypothetical protein